MSARGSNKRAGTSRHSVVEDTRHKTGRHAPRTPRVTVTHPQMTITEGAKSADPAALNTAITLFVKWAIRAHEHSSHANPEAPEAPTDHLSAD